MQTALIVSAALALLELLLYGMVFWRISRYLAISLAPLTLASSIWLLIERPTLAFGLVFILGLYRAFNLVKVFKQRLQANYLYSSTRLTSAWIIFGQLAITLIWAWLQKYSLSFLTWVYILASAQLAFSVLLLVSTFMHIRLARVKSEEADHLALKDLPTVTVAVPARNETEDLEKCLQALIASNYPKLEIIVLDDCSQERKTPEIIRSYAHDGVVFLAGNVPPDSWLAKNYAYKQLAEEANGDFLLFCGVDTRVEPHTITRLVEVALRDKKDMLSVLPKNVTKNALSLEPLFVQPTRYAWEISLPRLLMHNRPPVLSTFWLIKKATLDKAGGFQAVSRTISPESYFAKYISEKRKDAYGFIRSNQDIAVTSYKNTDEQNQTAIRTRYPQTHKRPELVAVISLVEFWGLVWPLLAFIAGLTNHLWALFGLSLAGFAITGLMSVSLASVTYRRFLPLSLLFTPVIALYDIALINYSMYKYEFSEVVWKGRNVCIPIMRAFPSLNEMPTSDSARE